MFKFNLTNGKSARYMISYYPYGFIQDDCRQLVYHYLKLAKSDFNYLKKSVISNGYGIVSLYDIKKDVRLDIAKGEK